MLWNLIKQNCTTIPAIYNWARY